MNNNKISLKEILRSQGVRNVTFIFLAILVFIFLITIYNIMLLRSIGENVVRRGQVAAEKSGNEFNEFLSECSNSVSIAEYTLNDLIKNNRPEEEILAFIEQQGASMVNTIGADTTKLYAYIHGMIFDGEQGVKRKPDYVIAERPWYNEAMSSGGKFALVDPYKDVHSGKIIMTISKAMSDGQSVVALDVSLEYIQSVIEIESQSNDNLKEMVLDSKGTVIAHTDTDEIGKNYKQETDTIGAVIAGKLSSASSSYFEFSFGGHSYTAYIVPMRGDWYSVSLLATADEYMPIRIMFLVTVLLSLFTLSALIIILIRSGIQGVLADRTNNQLSSAANIYLSLSDINLENMSLNQIKDLNPEFVKKVTDAPGDVQSTFFKLMDSLPDNPTKQAAREFVDLSTLNERLADRDIITLEYMSFEDKWVRARFLASERKPDGTLTHVLWMLEDITAEKQESDRLSKQAEKLTSQLSSAADIYISLCDLDIPNNSAVAIKNANPAIAKAVEAGKNNMQATFNKIMGGLPDTPTKQAALDFCDLSSIDEKLKDTNTITVEYISYGNIWVRGRYVVSERDANGKVTHVLWMLENIDAEKRARDRLSAYAEKLNYQTSSIASIYMSAYDFDLTNDTFSEVRATNSQVIDLVGGTRSNAQQLLYAIMEKITDESAHEMVHEFMDLSTLDDRLSNTKTITIEYMSNLKKWVRTRFIESERGADGKLRHVLLVAEDIDKEKQERDKLTRQAEKLSNQMLSIASIYMSAYDFDLIKDTFSVVRATNPQIIELLGENRSNAQQMLYHVMDNTIDESAKAAVHEFADLSTLNERLRDIKSITMEYQNRDKSWRRIRFIESERGPDGELRHVVLVGEDIDAEKRERDKLTEQTEKLTSQLSSAADIYISLCDLDIPNNSAVAIKNANPAIAKAVEAGKYDMQNTFNKIMGGLPDTPTKQAALDFCDLSSINEKLKDTNTITVEYISYGNIWVRGRYVVSERDENGNITHLLWMLENIDAEKRARDQLSAYAEKLNNQMSSIASIYMSAYDFDLMNDTFSEVRATNSQVIDVIGGERSNAQQLLYAIMMKITDESAHEMVHEFMDLSTLDDRLSNTKTITIEYLSNFRKWVRTRFIESERGPDGKLRHVLLVAEDIDKEKQEREALVDISERAIAASEAKSSFLSNMSHEIRTPINAVLGMNEMVLRESNEPNIITYSESIRTAGTSLLGLINDILDFSKIEAGKMEIIPVDYDLATMLNDLVNMIETRAEAKGLLIIPEFDREIPEHLHGDEVRIKQVITNILTNAVKYTEKGSVTLGVTYSKIEDEPDSILMKVSVKDTGIGIKKEDMVKLFSKFERIEEERNRTIEGTGLGMSITQSLLSMMGSSLNVESVYGEGSTFSFEIKQTVRKWDPLGDYKAAFQTAVSSREKYKEKFTAPDASVLVVDDTKMNLVVFTSLLKTTGVKIDTAESGDEGIMLALKNKYDIIFLDHMMPNKDGIETLKEIKAQESGPNINTPMICLTANAISGAREKYLEAGFDDYLTKPIESVRLEEMMCEYLPPEKIKAAAEVRKAPEKQEPKAVLPDFVFEISELDVIQGIKNAGSEEMYLELLKAYASMIDDHLDVIEDYWVRGDMANAAIKLHSLKGASRTIGAEWIRRFARKLGNAAENGDTQTVTAELDELKYRCKALAAQLSQLERYSEEKK